jgi:hypothetical protein
VNQGDPADDGRHQLPQAVGDLELVESFERFDPLDAGPRPQAPGIPGHQERHRTVMRQLVANHGVG